MRRHIWLYAECQAIFTSTIERQVVVESLNRTILLFDYATHVITQKYQELMKEEYDGKLAALRAIGMKGSDNVGKGLLMAVFLITAGLITYYYQAVKESGVIFTHLFYIPIILGCIWWKRRGIFVALALGIYLIISHLIFMREVPLADDIIRAGMFLVIGTVVAILAEGLTRADTLCTAEEGVKEKHCPKNLVSSVLQLLGSGLKRVISITRSDYLSIGSSPNSTCLSIKGGVHHDYQRGRSVQGNCIAHH